MAYKQNSPLNFGHKKLFNKIGSSVNNIFKPGKNKQTRLADRNKNRLERNLRVDYDPTKKAEFDTKFKALYDETDSRSKEDKLKDITESKNYQKLSGQGGTDIGNFLRQGKRNMILPTGKTNTEDNEKENAFTNLFNYNLESEYYGNRYLAKYPSGYDQTQES